VTSQKPEINDKGLLKWSITVASAEAKVDSQSTRWILAEDVRARLATGGVYV